MADLSIVLGSTLQIVPAGELPFTRKRIDGSAKTVICNLQKTKFVSIWTVLKFPPKTFLGYVNK